MTEKERKEYQARLEKVIDEINEADEEEKVKDAVKKLVEVRSKLQKDQSCPEAGKCPIITDEFIKYLADAIADRLGEKFFNNDEEQDLCDDCPYSEEGECVYDDDEAIDEEEEAEDAESEDEEESDIKTRIRIFGTEDDDGKLTIDKVFVNGKEVDKGVVNKIIGDIESTGK